MSTHEYKKGLCRSLSTELSARPSIVFGSLSWLFQLSPHLVAVGNGQHHFYFSQQCSKTIQGSSWLLYALMFPRTHNIHNQGHAKKKKILLSCSGLDNVPDTELNLANHHFIKGTGLPCRTWRQHTVWKAPGH